MFDKIAKKMLSPINTAGISILGVFNVFLGIWISLPFQSLDHANAVPEWLTAAIMLIVGFFILSGSIGNKYQTLLIGTQLSFYAWFLAAGGLIYADWQNVLWIIALMISVYSLFVSVNIKVNRENLPFKKL